MAKQANVKKIELMVSVNCCDGCKRKVKKALRGVEGVLQIEIDPFQPRVTVYGSADPKILIKRLLKSGKQAELWSSADADNEKKQVETSKVDYQLDRPSDHHVKTNDKIIESQEKGSKKEAEASQIAQVFKMEQPVRLIPVPEMNFGMYRNVQGNQTHYCYMVDPYQITMPVFSAAAIPHYPACCHDRPVYQPQFQVPTTRVGDYFSDDNTVGCSVM